MKNKKEVLSCLIIILAGVVYFPVRARQKNGGKNVVYQFDIEKSKLFWKAAKNQHYGFILFNSGALNNFTATWPTQDTFSINMNSMMSIDKPIADGRKTVNDKLRSEDFFNV